MKRLKQKLLTKGQLKKKRFKEKLRQIFEDIKSGSIHEFEL